MTDGRTDRQTDGIAIAYARLAYMLSRAIKNETDPATVTDLCLTDDTVNRDSVLSLSIESDSSVLHNTEVQVIEESDASDFNPQTSEIVTSSDVKVTTATEANEAVAPDIDCEHRDYPVTRESNDPALFVNKRITPSIISKLITSSCQPDKDHSFLKSKGCSFK